MTKGAWILTLASFLFCFAVIAYTGVKMPWNEDAALYAIYGAGAGSYVTTVLAMFMVWVFSKREK